MSPRPSLSVSIFVAAALLCCGVTALVENLDYFHLVLMWPGSYCEDKNLCAVGCCYPKVDQDPAVDFFVQGLYPRSLSGKVENCSDTRFYIPVLDPIVEELYLYWPSINCSSWSEEPFDYLKRAWDENGKCSGKTELNYFNNSLTLRSNINLLSMLETEGEAVIGYPIVPGDNVTYKYEDINTTLYYGLGGVSAGVKCNENVVTGGSQLFEVHICINATTNAYMECPPNELPDPDCGYEVFFPNFSLDMLKPLSATINPIKMHVGE